MPSKGEIELGKLLSSEYPNLRIDSQKTVKVGKLHLYVDFVIPALMLAFEVDGRQHEKYVPHFHKYQSRFHHSKENDGYKEEILHDTGYTLIRFASDEPITKQNLRSKIAHSVKESE